jgi:voltage-dependent potassium channel beta subunit
VEYRNVGRTGLKVSALSIGGWITLGGTVDVDASVAILREAEHGGINFIDLADIYAKGEAEKATGRYLADYTSTPGQSRADWVISSKVFWPMSDNPNNRGLSRKHIIESCEASLRRLGTDYLDLYFCHRFDDTVPLDETVRAMDDLVRQGKILYWGTSVWSADQLRDAHSVASAHGAYAPIVEQPCYNLLDRHIEDEVVPAAIELGMGLVVWSPLAQGVLTGKYDQGIPEGSRAAMTRWLDQSLVDETLERSRRFSALAAEAGVEPAQLALAWTLAQPGITSVITGASRPEQVRANLGANDIALTDALRSAIEQIFAG